MSLSALGIVQTFTDKLGLPRPSALYGATDKSSRQYQALLAETVRDLGEYRWQQQKVRGTFTSVAALAQGALTSLFGAGYAGLVKGSMWNVTRRMQIFGPISEQAWNALQTLPNAGPEFSCWISQNILYMSPTPRAGDTISAIYITKYNVLSTGTGTNYQELATADTDTFVFPDNVILRYFEAKWRKQKGESGWQDDYNDAMSLIAKNITRDMAGATLSLETVPNSGPRPGIIIPAGNWGV